MKNVQYVEISKFDQITTGKNVCYTTPNGVMFRIEYTGFNVNGNPKYSLFIDNGYIDNIKQCKNRCGRVLTNKQGIKYLTFTSYNLSNTVEHLFKNSNIDSGLI